MFVTLAIPLKYVNAHNAVDDLILQNETVPGGQVVEYVALDTVTAGPGYVIQGGAQVTFAAGGAVILNPGFHAEGGSQVTVRVWEEDSEAPAILSGFPETGTLVPAQGGSITMLLTFGDSASGMYSVTLYDDLDNDITSLANVTENTIELLIENPVDGHEYHYILVLEDWVGNTSNIDISFTADTTIPVTTASITGGNFEEPIIVELTCSEDATVYYSTDGYPPYAGAANTIVADAPVRITISKSRRLQFFAVDRAGNIEETKSEIYLFGELPGSLAGLEAVYDVESEFVILSWMAMPVPVRGYHLYRCVSAFDRTILEESLEGGYPPPKKLRLTSAPVTETQGFDSTTASGITYWYGVTVENEQGIEGTISTLVPVTIPPAAAADSREAILKARAYLEMTQNKEGSWGEKEELRLLYTSQVLNALRLTGDDSAGIRKGLFYLRGRHADNNDYLARKILTLHKYGQNVYESVNRLISEAFSVGEGLYSWGIQKRFGPDALDMALCSRAVDFKNPNTPWKNYGYIALRNVDYIKSNEIDKYGWVPGGPPNIYVSSLAYNVLRDYFVDDAPVYDDQWILDTQAENQNGSFGNGLIDTAAVLLWLEISQEAKQAAVDYLVSNREENGSWSNDPYVTGLCLEAMLTAKILVPTQFDGGYFDGDDYISVPQRDEWKLAGRDFTISFKVKLEDDGRPYHPFLAHGNEGWRLFYNSQAGLIWFDSPSSLYFNSYPPINLFDGQFHWIKLSRTGSYFGLWVDDVLYSSCVYTPKVFDQTTGILQIAKGLYSWAYLRGDLTDISIKIDGPLYLSGHNSVYYKDSQDFSLADSDFKISLKVKLEDDGRADHPLLAKGINGWRLYYSRTYDVLFFKDGNLSVNTRCLDLLLFDGQYHQIDLQRTGSSFYIRIDGEQYSSLTSDLPISEDSGSLYIGRRYINSKWHYCKGSMDEIRIVKDGASILP
jgi:hypothetical protein